MGFRSGAYCTVWEVQPIKDTMTKIRLSISRKNKNTGEYENEFSDYVVAVGTACANKAMKLGKGDRIRIGDCDVSNMYNKEKRVVYYNFKIFSFEVQEPNGGNGGGYSGCNAGGNTSANTSYRGSGSDNPYDGDTSSFEDDDKELPF